VELKEFITETISSIMSASEELQVQFSAKPVSINPALTGNERDAFDKSSTAKRFARVTKVEFDVAVVASSDTSGGGKASLKVLGVGLDGGVDRKTSQEATSRVKFDIFVELPSNTLTPDAD